jgi:hypothetical protein
MTDDDSRYGMAAAGIPQALQVSLPVRAHQSSEGLRSQSKFVR